MTSRAAFSEGVKDTSPLLIGVVPFALAFGVVVADSTLNPLVGWLSSPLIFGGAAQLVMVDLMNQDTALAVTIATGLVINARHMMYSASLAPAFQEFPRAWQLAGPYVLTDQTFAISDNKFRVEFDPAYRRSYYAGVGVLLIVVWNATTALGIILGAGLPDAWSLDFAVPLMFLALLAPAIRNRPSVVAAVVGGVVAYVGSDLTLNLGLLVGGLAGIAAGYAAEAKAEAH